MRHEIYTMAFASLLVMHDMLDLCDCLIVRFMSLQSLTSGRNGRRSDPLRYQLKRGQTLMTRGGPPTALLIPPDGIF